VKCLVLGARRYSFEDEGRTVEGVSVHYLDEDFEPNTEEKGQLPFKISAPLSVFDQLNQLPGVYEVDIRRRPGRGGRPSDQVVGVSYLGPAFAGAPNGSKE
jgi:hypothetical protein